MNFVRFGLIALCLANGGALAAAASSKPIFFFSQTTLPQPKLWANLKRKCDSEIVALARPVAALAPLPRYSVDGTNAKDPQAEAFVGDGRIAYRASLCFALSGETKYAQHAQTIIDAWAATLKSVPNAQGIADINFDIPFYVIAASIVAGSNRWDQTQTKKFLIDIVKPLSRAAQPNNHGNWGVVLNASIAAYLDDQPTLKQAAERWQALLNAQVADDGSLPLEICRSDSSDHCGGARKGINGMAYTHFTLLPATLAAEIFKSRGIDVYSSSAGAKLKAAYVKATQWTLNPKSFPYFESNGGKLNGLEKCGYFAVLQKQYGVTDAALNAELCKSDPFFLKLLYQ